MNKDEEAVRKLIGDWLAAAKAGDTRKVVSLMAEDAVFLLPGKPPIRGRAAFAEAQEALKDFNLETHSYIQEIRVMGDWAYSWTTLTVTVTPRQGGGEGVTRSGNTLSILRKTDDGNWVLYRDANLLMATEE
jgi:uncharacterized protein (TIGR02246 family)